VAGEPGIGKTRLCLELLRQCDARGAVVAQAHCPAHASSLALLPIVELLRSLFGVRDGEAAESSRRKIQRALLPLSRGFTDFLPVVFDLLEVADPQQPVRIPDEERRPKLVAFLRRLVQAQSAAAPLVVFVDDLHCINPDGDALLGEMVDALGWTRTLLLVTFRPQHRSDWMGASYYREIALAALADDDVDALLRRLVGDDESTDPLRQLIRERTGGNPFFAEEVVQSLVEHGILTRDAAEPGDGADTTGAAPHMRLAQPIAELSIPPTIQALLAARLDRLAERDKLVLQAAAVIGPRFMPAVLQHVLEHEPATSAGAFGGAAVEEALAELGRADFIRRDELHGECAFKHPLTQAVAYGSQLASSRARLHVGVARALQALNPDQLGQVAELIAHHFAAADWRFEATRWRRRAALRVTKIELRRHHRT